MSISTEAVGCGNIADLEQAFNAIFVKVVKDNSEFFALRGKLITGNTTAGVNDTDACGQAKPLDQRILESIGLDVNSDPALNFIHVEDTGATVTEVACGNGLTALLEILARSIVFNSATGEYGIALLEAQ